MGQAKADLASALMWKRSFVDLTNQATWKRVLNKDHKFGQLEHINTCTDPNGVQYVATDKELEEMRERALKNQEDFEATKK